MLTYTRRLLLSSKSALRHMSSIRDIRIKYEYDGNLCLNDDVVKTLDPFGLFKSWIEEAVKEKVIKQPNAMVVSTSNSQGRPSARWALLKEYDTRGFTFYTCLTSRKAKELKENPFAALTLYWEFFHRQIRIEGRVEEVSRQESENYFISRPKGSQISASLSPQSDIVPDRKFLEDKYKKLDTEYINDSTLPLPDHWGGFRVVPDYFEFWAGNTDRLHDRYVFDKRINDSEIDSDENRRYLTKNSDGWCIYRIAP